MILHLRVAPGFWVAVEELRHPERRSHPIILGGLPHQRGSVREVNFFAQRRGVQPGMTLAQAHQLCPDGLFLMPDLPVYTSVWEIICDILQRFTPLVQPLEMGQAVCDLAGCEQLWGDATEIARAITAEVHRSTGIIPWFGAASNRLVAQLASMVEGVTVIERGRERRFLADLPLTLLPDVDARLALAFQVLGLKTIGQLAVLPASAVGQRFGAVGRRLHAYAHGVDSRPVTPPPDRPSVSIRQECDEGSIDEAMGILHRLAERSAEDLQERRLAGTVVELRLELSPDSPQFPASLPPRKGGTVDGALEDSVARPLPSAPLEEGGPEVRDVLPVPYRIHSRLPQPGRHSIRSQLPQPGMRPSNDYRPAVAAPLPLDHSYALPIHASTPPTVAKAVVRIPIDTPARLFDIAQRLLRRCWLRDRTVYAIELRVSEFPAPKQLSLDGFGDLSGVSAERLHTLAEQEQILITRYGDASFRRLGGIDPGNILTERRFRWQSGLPWDAS